MVGLGLLLLGCLGGVSEGANILAVFPTPSYSHQVFYRVYVRALLERGHNLTVVTPNPLNDPTISNYREIDTSYMYTEFRKLFDVSSDSGKTHRVAAELLFVLYAIVIRSGCSAMLSDPNLMDIYRRNEQFDLFVVEWGTFTCVLPFERLAGGRMIGISSFELGAISQLQLGSAWSPSFAADPNLDYTDRMSFFQRVRSTLLHVTSNLFTLYLRGLESAMAREHFGGDVDTRELEKRAALVFENCHVTMSYPRANNLNVIPLGGPAFHLNGWRAQALPKELKDFLDDAPNGVIYFSLGTNVKTNNISSKVEEILMESFGRIRQKVLWKWENENLRVNLKNVKVGRWFPQVDVLAHPNVRAFVTQGGLQSVGEAMEFQVPMVVMPFFADQGHNARKMELEGVALNLDFDALDADTFTAALNDIVSNKKYRDNMARLSALVRDQPVPPLEKAVWWTEYVIRHNGAPHLRSAAATMPWYQYLMLDVLAVILLAVGLLLYLAYSAVRFVLGRVVKPKQD